MEVDLNFINQTSIDFFERFFDWDEDFLNSHVNSNISIIQDKSFKFENIFSGYVKFIFNATNFLETNKNRLIGMSAKEKFLEIFHKYFEIDPLVILLLSGKSPFHENFWPFFYFKTLSNPNNLYAIKSLEVIFIFWMSNELSKISKNDFFKNVQNLQWLDDDKDDYIYAWLLCVNYKPKNFYSLFIRNIIKESIKNDEWNIFNNTKSFSNDFHTFQNLFNQGISNFIKWRILVYDFSSTLHNIRTLNRKNSIFIPLYNKKSNINSISFVNTVMDFTNTDDKLNLMDSIHSISYL